MSDLAEKRTRSSQSREASASSTSNKTPRRDFFTHSMNTSSSKRSPVSPTRITRLQEKEEMQSLNDRLIIYIDTVRALQSENNRLKNEINSTSEGSTREVSEIKVLYERELMDAKRLIDELAREKAKFEIDLNKHKANANEATEKLSQNVKILKEAHANLNRTESELSEYKSRCDKMSGDLNRKTDELKTLKPHNAELEKHLAKLKKQLEEETLCRVDLENKNFTLKEDLNFKSQVYETETDQLRSSKRNEIELVDNRLRDEYDSKLMNELNQIRDEAENKIREMKEEVEKRYQNKFKDSETCVKRSQNTIDALRDELTSMRSKATEYELDLKNLNTKVALYESRQIESEDKLKKQAAKFEKDMAEKDAEIDKASQEINGLMGDYQELYDIKIALDMEIEAYRKILEAEESRLNITSNTSKLGASYMNDSTSGPSSKKSKKRKVDGGEVVNVSECQSIVSTYEQSSQTSVGIEIGEMEFDYKSLKLKNTSDKDTTVGGWILKQLSDGNEVDYKLPKSRVIKAGETLSIWSSGMRPDSASDDLVLSGNKQWLSGSLLITVMNDKDGTELSRRECKKVQVDQSVNTSTSSEVKRESRSTFSKLFTWGSK